MGDSDLIIPMAKSLDLQVGLTEEATMEVTKVFSLMKSYQRKDQLVSSHTLAPVLSFLPFLNELYVQIT